jgi:hypothetical protein
VAVRIVLVTGLLVVSAACIPSESVIGTAIARTPTQGTVGGPAVSESTRPIEQDAIQQRPAEVPRAPQVEVTPELAEPSGLEQPVTVTATQSAAIDPAPDTAPSDRSTLSTAPPITPMLLVHSRGRSKTATSEAHAPLTAPRGDGSYLVGLEIAPGIWESTGTGSDCHWARLDGSLEVIDSHFGAAGGTVTIQQTDYRVEFANCGSWRYLGP